MAGGRFDAAVGKIRPGTYINVISTRTDNVPLNERGKVLLPLLGHPYGPAGEFISIKGNAPDASRAKLGFSIYDDHINMLLIREAFKKASEVIVYIPKEGKKATVNKDGLTATAMYGGTRGDDLRYSVVDDVEGGFDVTVYMEADAVFIAEGVKTVEELAGFENDWVKFSGAGELKAAAGVKLAGGTDGEMTNSDITNFLDKSEGEYWNCLAFPYEGKDGDTALQQAVAAKIIHLNDNVGKYRRAVVANYAADSEFVFNVTNGVKLGNRELSAAMCTAYLAGADAGASVTTSYTHTAYPGATGVVGEKMDEAAKEAIKNGEIFFRRNDDGTVIIEYDINSLVNIPEGKDKSYRKGRVIRTIYTILEEMMQEFRPNRFDNDEDGWGVMEGLGRAKLEKYGPRPNGLGALKNVDTDNDFWVERDTSTGDETYLVMGLEPVDSSEKLFIKCLTR